MFDTLIHRWAKIPYSLHIEERYSVGRSRATLIFLHGIGNSSQAWEAVIKKMPDDVRIISIDLLGFGNSPQPVWAQYNAHTQARSVIATLLRMRVAGRVYIIGHSLGALVAIDIAKRYPLAVKELILCSPPFYLNDIDKPRLLPRSDQILTKLYQTSAKYPDQFIKMAQYAKKYGVTNRDFNVTSENVDSYFATLESAIINQTSYADATKLKIPIHIIKGRVDAFVISRHLRSLAKDNTNVSLQMIAAGHEVRGLFIPAVVEKIFQVLPPKHTKQNQGVKTPK